MPKYVCIVLLDLDGVLNSKASVARSLIRRLEHPSEIGPVNEDLCPECCSNFRLVLKQFPEARIVITSSWRLSFSLDELRIKLIDYGIDGSRVIGSTPLIHESQHPRGDDITAWLEIHPEVTSYVIIDDNDDMTTHMDHLVKTDYAIGLTRANAVEVIRKLQRRTNR
jgi:hypothetical protein